MAAAARAIWSTSDRAVGRRARRAAPPPSGRPGRRDPAGAAPAARPQVGSTPAAGPPATPTDADGAATPRAPRRLGPGRRRRPTPPRSDSPPLRRAPAGAGPRRKPTQGGGVGETGRVDQPLRAAGPADLDEAAARIDLARWLRLIDADEHEGRLAHLRNVRTMGELHGLLDGIPPMASCSNAVPPTCRSPSQQPGILPGFVVAGPVLGCAGQGPTTPAHLAAAPGRAAAGRGHRSVRAAVRTGRPAGDQPPDDAAADPHAVGDAVTARRAQGDQRLRDREPRALDLRDCSCCPPTAILGVAAGHWSLAQIKVSDRALQQGTVVAIGEPPQSGRAAGPDGRDRRLRRDRPLHRDRRRPRRAGHQHLSRAVR